MKAEMEKYLVWNGSLRTAHSLEINPLSEAWLYGYGCFETMAFSEKGIRFFAAHWERLTQTVDEMGLECPLSQRRLGQAVEQLAAENHCPAGTARLSLHVDGSRVDWMVRVYPRTSAGEGGLRLSISRFPHPGPSPLSRWKSNNYLLNLAAFREARDAGFDETLLLHGDEVVEGSQSNLWLLKDNELTTPPLSSGALPGVTRQQILTCAGKMEIKLRERPIQKSELQQADGLFLSNTGRLFSEAEECEGALYPSHPEMVKEIRDRLRNA